jgi:hypothetical protein
MDSRELMEGETRDDFDQVRKKGTQLAFNHTLVTSTSITTRLLGAWLLGARVAEVSKDVWAVGSRLFPNR